MMYNLRNTLYRLLPNGWLSGQWFTTDIK